MRMCATGQPHCAAPGCKEVSDRGGEVPPQPPLLCGPPGSPWKHTTAHCLQGWQPAVGGAALCC